MKARLEATHGDITAERTDVVVNAANTALARGAGVCGAIFAAAGPGLAEACAELGGCSTGDAKATPGFGLPARFIVHAVGPVWAGGAEGEPDALASATAGRSRRPTAWAPAPSPSRPSRRASSATRSTRPPTSP